MTVYFEDSSNDNVLGTGPMEVYFGDSWNDSMFLGTAPMKEYIFWDYIRWQYIFGTDPKTVCSGGQFQRQYVLRGQLKWKYVFGDSCNDNMLCGNISKRVCFGGHLRWLILGVAQMTVAICFWGAAPMTICSNNGMFWEQFKQEVSIRVSVKVMTALWILKSNLFKCIFASDCMWLRKTNTDRQTEIWIDINGEVKVAVILSKMIFFPAANFFLHMWHIQYVFND